MDDISRHMVDQPIPDRVVAALADKEHMAGWYHNPYAPLSAKDKGSPDAVATAIALDYIELFTQALHKRGFMPFTGAEINFDAHGTDQKTEEYIVKRLTQIGDFLNTHRTHSTLLADSNNANYAQDYAHIIQHDPGEIRNPECRELIGELRRNSIISIEDIEKIRRHLPLEHNINSDWRSHFVSFAIRLEESSTKNRGGIFHNPMAKENGVYLDSFNVEVCTPVLSPKETVELVNFYKRIFYESSSDFSDALQNAGVEAKDVHSLRHNLAQWIRAGVDPFGISYSIKANSSGEHLSLSLQADPHREKTYATLPDEVDKHCEDTVFARDNIMRYEVWLNFINNTLQTWLPQDEILTIGLDSRRTATFSSEGSRIWRDGNNHFGGDLETSDKQRVETRDFGHSGSNIALAILGQLACVYAAIDKLDPYTQQHPTSLKPEEVKHVANALAEQFGRHPDARIYPELKHAFQHNGLTLKMMKQVAEESAANPEELRNLLVQRRKFEDAVCKRAASIMKSTPQRGFD